MILVQPGSPRRIPLAGAVTLRQWLLTGVSYMIPFVVTGGILIALAQLLGGPDLPHELSGEALGGPHVPLSLSPTDAFHTAGHAGLLYWVGATALSMLVPVLAGFIAYAMAGPVALVAGVVGGLVSVAVDAGYLGGMLAGMLAGGIALLLSRARLPLTLAGMSTVVIVPVVSTLLVSAAVLLLFGPPIAAAQAHLTGQLANLSDNHIGLLGAVLGLMVALDMGGPVNKLAYAFALTALASANGHVMAAVLAAAMTPPLAMALASTVRPGLFTEPERAAGKAGWLLGASSVTEGAIPFAVADPLRVIPSLMAGSAVAGWLSITAGATSLAPHGGIWMLGLVTTPLPYLGAVLAGVLTTTVAVVTAKALGHRRTPRQPGHAGSEAATPTYRHHPRQEAAEPVG